MIWNYRIIRKDDSYAIHEVYYKGKRAFGCTDDPVTLVGEDVEDLRHQYEQMKEAFAQPVLEWEDFEV